MTAPGQITVTPVTGVGEVTAGDDLAATLAAGLRDGDVLVVTSKVVSKAEGRVVPTDGTDRDAHLAAETDRVVARRGGTSIVRTRHGLVMAAAGIDASNTEPGTLVLLPVDPDGSARTLREALRHQSSDAPNVAVVVSDTSGRAWRNGQTDIAIGAAGLEVLDAHAGRVDRYGNVLAVTAPATADEIAGAADLATGKLSGHPAAVLRGLSHLVLPAGRHGPGAVALVRPEEADMFGLGAREAVLTALLRTRTRGFGAAVPADDLVAWLCEVLPDAVPVGPHGTAGCVVELPAASRHMATARAAGAAVERAATLAHALGWALVDESETAGAGSTTPATRLRFTPGGP